MNNFKWQVPWKTSKKITQLKAWTYGKKKEYTMEKVY